MREEGRITYATNPLLFGGFLIDFIGPFDLANGDLLTPCCAKIHCDGCEGLGLIPARLVQESELDRFLIKIKIDYPSHSDEVQLTLLNAAQMVGGKISSVESLIDITAAQKQSTRIDVDARVAEYVVSLVRQTRNTSLLRHGASPRASIALLKCAKAVALMNGEHFVTPDDVKSMALPVLRHRVILAPEVEIDGLAVDDVLRTLLEKVDAPRS